MINNELKLSIIEEANKIKTKINNYNRNNTKNRRLFSKAIKKEIASFYFKYQETGIELHQLLDISKQSIQRWAQLYPSKKELNKEFKKVVIRDRKSVSTEVNERLKFDSQVENILRLNRLVVAVVIILSLVERLLLR